MNVMIKFVEVYNKEKKLVVGSVDRISFEDGLYAGYVLHFNNTVTYHNTINSVMDHLPCNHRLI